MEDPIEYQMEVESEIQYELNRDYCREHRHTVNISIELIFFILKNLRDEAKELESKVYCASHNAETHSLYLRLYHVNAQIDYMEKVLKEEEPVSDPLYDWAIEQVSIDKVTSNEGNEQENT